MIAPTLLRITDDTTPQEICEAITNLAATAARMPDHWTERRAAIHARIDVLLDELAARG